ncbi:galectin-related protein-like [Gigantopelta aegis]|uniref:galectin-related protein-like n=1 Tax=Gigantopelta aegis TaxID=1735272 RepID=UPI001B887AC1|nr:galectin-related protein-like [Gigantopelta aegis]
MALQHSTNTSPHDISFPVLIIPGWKIEAIGTPLHSPRFTFNLMHDDDRIIPLQVDVRFNAAGRINTVVRNSFTGGLWGKEDTDQPSFPFAPDQQFNLTILVTGNGFELTVDGHWHVTWNHSVSPSEITAIRFTQGCIYESVKLFY